MSVHVAGSFWSITFIRVILSQIQVPLSKIIHMYPQAGPRHPEWLNSTRQRGFKGLCLGKMLSKTISNKSCGLSEKWTHVSVFFQLFRILVIGLGQLCSKAYSCDWALKKSYDGLSLGICSCFLQADGLWEIESLFISWPVCDQFSRNGRILGNICFLTSCCMNDEFFTEG